MEIKILNDAKESVEFQIDSLTMVELLRAYLVKDSNVEFAAWKRNHPTEDPILSVKGKNPKKSLKDAAAAVTKDLEKVEKDFAKLK